MRLIAGELGGMAGPGLDPHADLADARLGQPWRRAPSCRGTRASTVWCTSSPAPVEFGPERRPVQIGQLAVFGAGRLAQPSGPPNDRTPRSRHLEVLVLGGEPIGEHVEHYGPFVMNTRAEIGQAVEDFQAGRLGQIPPNALMPHVPDPAPVRTERTGI